MSTLERYQADTCVTGAMVKDTTNDEVVCICPRNRKEPEIALKRAQFFAKCINEHLVKRGGKP